MTKILVVDDEANVQRLLQYTLKQAGYTVVVAGDGQEALKLWQSEQPRAVHQPGRGTRQDRGQDPGTQQVIRADEQAAQDRGKAGGEQATAPRGETRPDG